MTHTLHFHFVTSTSSTELNTFVTNTVATDAVILSCVDTSSEAELTSDIVDVFSAILIVFFAVKFVSEAIMCYGVIKSVNSTKNVM